MSKDKISDTYAGAPGAVKSPTAKAYDLFKTFRHAPANANTASEDKSSQPAAPAAKPEK